MPPHHQDRYTQYRLSIFRTFLTPKAFFFTRRTSQTGEGCTGEEEEEENEEEEDAEEVLGGKRRKGKDKRRENR